jgi:hypothetical protein
MARASVTLKLATSMDGRIRCAEKLMRFLLALAPFWPMTPY